MYAVWEEVVHVGAVLTGRLSPGLANILRHPLGPTPRQLQRWLEMGLLNPHRRQDGNSYARSWDECEQQRAIDLARLVRIGIDARRAAAMLDDATNFKNGGRYIQLDDGHITIWMRSPDRVDT